MQPPEANGAVLIVVPCLNEEAHLPALLPWLLHEADQAIIVVADGGSDDRSREIVEALAEKHANLVLLLNPKRIQSAAVNLAACKYGAGRDWLIRIDAHADYPEGFIRQLLATARIKGATSVVVPMVTKGIGCFQRAAAAAQNSVLGTGGAAHRHLGRGQWVEHGHHALFDLNLFMAVGGYDENFAANEDSELDRRLLAAGGRIWLEPGAAITYYPRANMPALFRQYRNYGKGRARNVKRHSDRLRRRQMLPLVVVPAILVALAGVLFAPAQAEALLLTAPMLCWATVSLLAGGFLGWRTRCVCVAMAGGAAMTMHLGWAVGFLTEVIRRRALPAPPRALTFEPAQAFRDEKLIKTLNTPSMMQ